MKHPHRPSKFLFWEITGNFWRDLRAFVVAFFRRVKVQSFTHPVGDSHLVQAAVLKSDNVTPGTTGTDVVYTVDFPAVASIQPNAGVAKQLQVQVGYLSPGTATITATGTDENGNPFSTSFQAVVTPVAPLLSNQFVFSELN